MKDRLTKTAYLNYLKCPQEFWLAFHQPLLISVEPDSLEYEHLRQQGYAVQQYVKKLAQFQPNDQNVVDFERIFQTSHLYARTDVAVADITTGEIDIYEVKSASKVKEEHYDDVAFQKMTAERSGFLVRNCYVISMNGDYIRQGAIDPEQLFVITDVTQIIAERMEATDRQAKDAVAYLDSVPVPSLVDYCVDNKLNCGFIKLHFPDLPEYTVFDIAFLKNEKRRDLLSQGIVSITDVPESFPLSRKQAVQVAAAKSGQIIIEQAQIADILDGFQYPLHFLDYETFAYAIPQFDGVKPFQQMCFQYSLHTLEEPGGELKHTAFLSYGHDDRQSIGRSPQRSDVWRHRNRARLV